MDLQRIEDIIANSNDKVAMRYMNVAQKLLKTIQNPNKRHLIVGSLLFVLLLGLIGFLTLFYFHHIIASLLIFILLCFFVAFGFWFLLFVHIPFDNWSDLIIEKKRLYLNNILKIHGIKLPKSKVREEMFNSMKETMIIWTTFLNRKECKDKKEKDEIREELQKLLEETENGNIPEEMKEGGAD